MSADEIPDSERVLVGVIGRAHGLRGELAVTPYCDDGGFLVGLETLAVDDHGSRQTLTPRRLREHSGRWLVVFDSIESREAARALTGLRLMVAPADLPPAPDDHPYHFELLGMTVVDSQGVELGQVRAIESLPTGDLLALDEARKILIPFRPMVKRIDRARGVIEVDLPPGLLEVNS